VACALAALAARPDAAWAHATLLRSEPADRSVVATAPHEVRFVFTEDVRLAGGNEVVRNGGGSVLAGPARIAAGDTLVLPLRRLSDGDYSVRWSVVSDDGHREQGVIAFGVGAGRAPPVATLTASSEVRTEDVVSRTLFLLGVLVAAGALLQLRRVLSGYGLVVAAFGLAFLGGSSLLHTADAGGTRFALALQIGTTAALVGGAAAALVPWYPRVRAIAWAAAAVLLVVPTVSGHALDSGRPRALAVPVDLLHVAGAAVWLGGLAALAFAVPREAAGAEARRFSPVALGSVVVIAVTGAVRAVVELDSVSQLWSTGYGQAILVKTGLFVLLLGLGWANRYRLLPALDRAAEALARLRISVRAEVTLLVGVVAAVGVLTALRPAGQAAVAAATAAPGEPAPPPTPPAGALQLGRQDRDLAVGLSATREALTITLLSQDGTGPDGGASVAVDGRDVETASCGPGCLRAAPMTRGTVVVSPAGRPPVSFSLSPALDADGLLRRSERAFLALRTVTIHESLASGPGQEARSIQHMVAPNRFTYELTDGTAGVVIGGRRWDRIGHGRWRETAEPSPLRMPVPLWTSARRDARLVGPHRIAFLDPSVPAWFDVRLDPRTALPTHVRMVAAAHFMTDRYSRFDRPVRISPPR
jgi:copper transport protein